MSRKICMLAIAAALLVLAPAAGAVTPVGHWKLDDGSGSTAADSSGNGNAGNLGGTTSWITGKRGGALHVSGSGAGVRIARSSILEPASGITVSAWVRRTGSPGAYKYVVAKGATGCIAASYALYTGHDGGLGFYVSGQLGYDFTASPFASADVWDGSWHLATGTFDGATVRLYVDGTEVGSGTPRPAGITYNLVDDNDLLIGHYDWCANLDYEGDVDDVRVYDRALTAQELKTLDAYAFQGFFAPVDNAPTLNAVKAGSAVPVKFSLTGYQGMDILAAGSPSSQAVTCSTSAPVDTLELTSTAGSSSLSYDATSDRYNYVWKTDKAWAGTCRQLNVALADGSVHSATFKFAK